VKLIVLTPEKEIFSGDVDSLSVPGSGGRFEILAGHAPIVSSLQEGKVRIKQKGNEGREFMIEQGFVEVLKDEISLLVRGFKEIEA
jgi:F-type H+-transporting ATPase subunit epsilon